MFHVTAQEATSRSTLRSLFGRFDDDDGIWQGDAGDLLIGDASGLDGDDTAQYECKGTVSEWLEDLSDADA